MVAPSERLIMRLAHPERILFKRAKHTQEPTLQGYFPFNAVPGGVPIIETNATLRYTVSKIDSGDCASMVKGNTVFVCRLKYAVHSVPAEETGSIIHISLSSGYWQQSSSW